MVRLHRQPAVQYKFSEQGDLLGVFDRTHHIALAVRCSHCDANASVPCRSKDGALFSPLTVHIERMNDFL